MSATLQQAAKKNDYLRESTVLVTGGTGSIGQALVSRLLTQNVAELRVLSRDKTAQENLLTQHDATKRLTFVQGNVESEAVVREAMKDINYVFHVAAMKHVPGCENDPIKATQVNILGSNHIFAAATQTDTVKKVVAVSTDKAILPGSVMGASKVIMERTALKYAREVRETTKQPAISIVRPGNVMASQGSVLPFFLRQIRNGGPVTVTHDEMTRFTMTIPETIELLLSAAMDSQGGEIYIKKMGAMRIIDLARVMVEHIAPLVQQNPENIEIKIIGPRPGETFHEHLVTEAELPRTADMDTLYKIYPVALPDDVKAADAALLATDTAPKMPDEAILDLLRRLNYLDKAFLES